MPLLSLKGRWIIALLLVTLFLSVTLPVSPGVSAFAAPLENPVEQLTPVLVSVLFPPTPVKTTDGNFHLVYELSLTNTHTGNATIESAEVRDPSRSLTVSSLSADDVAKNLKALGATSFSPTLGTGQAGILWLDFFFASREEIPASIDHQVTATLQEPAPETSPQSSVTAGASFAIPSGSTPFLIGSPLRGSNWTAGNACCALSGHRLSVIPIDDKLSAPERFAIDWIKLDSQNRVFNGDPTRLESYPTFGEPVIAVLDATVIEAVDRYPDLTPPQSAPVSSLQETGGNHVILNLGGGHYALYAHLKQGSIRVHPGDHVKQGDVLGLVGNSGNSEAPHLHFQITNGPGDGSQGIPYVINSFRFGGKIDSASADTALSEGAPVQVNTAQAGPRRDELPMDGDVIAFP